MKIRKVFSLFFITMLLCVITACSDTSDNESINKYGSSSASSNGSVIGSGSGFGSDSSSSSDNSDGFESSGDNGSSDDGNNEEDDEPVSLQKIDDNIAYIASYTAYTIVKYCNYKYALCSDSNTSSSSILESAKNAVDSIINSEENDSTYIALFNNAQEMFVKAQNDLIDLYIIEDNEKITYSKTTSISDATKTMYNASETLYSTILDIRNIIANGSDATDDIDTAWHITYYASIVSYYAYQTVNNSSMDTASSNVATAVANSERIISTLYN